MLSELLIGTGLILTTVLTHGVGIFLLGRWLRVEAREEAEENTHPLSFRGIMVTLGLVLGLFVLHAVEIFTYAVVYRMLDALPTFDQAIYFSTITYSTTGYNSEGLATHWEMIAAIEGLNGFLLLGWSTAFFVTVVARMRGRR
ncbi:ion channel [Parasphingorhabdus sp.]|uniref:ion channel n=1 Tax=Parasphingorhabdus sp. TaxID=2709688 RepID=UPI003A8F5251